VQIITIANQKGGVGKTTTTVNLAGGLAHLGKRVLVIDTDSQANATFALTSGRSHDNSIYQLLTSDSVDLEAVIHPTNEESVDIIPSDQVKMKGIERELTGVVGEQTLLLSALQALQNGRYDFVLIDTPPHIGPLMVNAIVASERVIVPVQPGVFSLQGIQDVIDVINLSIKRLGRTNLDLLGILVNLYERTNVTRDTIAILKEHFGAKLMTAQIPKNVSLEEAHSRGHSIFSYAPQSAGALAFLQLAQEVIASYD
jgi:chromosome partitioning protein